MRIIGEYDLSGIKITVFKMNERVSVKFEKNLCEQIYKFRDGSGIQNFDDVKKFVDDIYISEIGVIFEKMEMKKYQRILKFNEMATEEYFDEII